MNTPISPRHITLEPPIDPEKTQLAVIIEENDSKKPPDVVVVNSESKVVQNNPEKPQPVKENDSKKYPDIVVVNPENEVVQSGPKKDSDIVIVNPESNVVQNDSERPQALPTGLINQALSCLPEKKTNTNNIDALYAFVERLRDPEANAEIAAFECLRIYKDDTSFLISTKELQKLLPNINIKREERLLKLFGVEKLKYQDPRDLEKKFYALSPKQYIMANMINLVSYSNFEQRIQFAFRMYDHDEDGKISVGDLKKLFSFYGEESQFGLTEEIIEEIAKLITEEIGTDKDGMITLAKFKQFFEKAEGRKAKINVFERGKAETPRRIPSSRSSEIRLPVVDLNTTMTQVPSSLTDTKIVNPVRWKSATVMRQGSFSNLKGQLDQSKSQISIQNPSDILAAPSLDTLPVIKENRTFWGKLRSKLEIEKAKWIWLLIWLLGAIALWVVNFLKYFNQTDVVAVGIAKGCASVIYYNMGLMFLLITKSVTTLLRKIYLYHLLPLNFNVYFHRILGITTLIMGFCHGLCHICGSYRALSSQNSVEELNAILHTPVNQVRSYTWWLFASLPSITGYIIIVLMTILVIFAIKKNRRKNYERFWYTHMLWLPIIILISFHGSKEYIAQQYFIYCIGPPAFILIVEKLFDLISLFWRKFKITDLTYLSSDLIELKVSKPKKFKFKPGQYALINLKELSRIQWHPFSYSSGPSEELLTFHISPAGDWTKKLKKMAINYKQGKVKLPTIAMRGPYGAPSQHYNDYKHLMIFCTGVGATPFASILREFVHKALQDKSLDKYSVDFFWMCRHPTHHRWLSELFVDLQTQEKANEVVRIHMFFTGPHEKYDLRMFLLWIGLNKLYEKGTKVKGMEHFNIMHWGRPNWDEIFVDKKVEVGRGRVGVFFCGNDFLAKEIREKCYKHSKGVTFNFSKEIF